jgi:hypothetical protein
MRNMTKDSKYGQFPMEDGHSSKADRCSADQKIPRLLWNPEVHYLDLILSQPNSVHTLIYYFF